MIISKLEKKPMTDFMIIFSNCFDYFCKNTAFVPGMFARLFENCISKYNIIMMNGNIYTDAPLSDFESKVKQEIDGLNKSKLLSINVLLNLQKFVDTPPNPIEKL
jgi:hypothetical protein